VGCCPCFHLTAIYSVRRAENQLLSRTSPSGGVRPAVSFLLPVSHAAYHRRQSPESLAPLSIYRAEARCFKLFYV
jgi:hypothetical protein